MRLIVRGRDRSLESQHCARLRSLFYEYHNAPHSSFVPGNSWVYNTESSRPNDRRCLSFASVSRDRVVYDDISIYGSGRRRIRFRNDESIKRTRYDIAQTDDHSMHTRWSNVAKPKRKNSSDNGTRIMHLKFSLLSAIEQGITLTNVITRQSARLSIMNSAICSELTSQYSRSAGSTHFSTPII